MQFWLEIGLILFICFFLGTLAYIKKVLTPLGSLSAVLIGLVIGLAGGLSWVLLLFIFLLTSFLATRYKFALKKERGVQEGKKGERGWKNVLASGLVPVAIVLLSLEGAPYPTLDKATGTVLFLCAVGIAAADTLASELGVLSKRTWLITTGERVRPGVDGGISVRGQLSAAGAAFYTGLLGIIVIGFLEPDLGLHWWTVPLVTVIGFLGCQIDSVIGATIERKGYVTKLTNNLISITLGTIIAWLMIIWIL